MCLAEIAAYYTTRSGQDIDEECTDILPKPVEGKESTLQCIKLSNRLGFIMDRRGMGIGNGSTFQNHPCFTYAFCLLPSNYLFSSYFLRLPLNKETHGSFFIVFAVRLWRVEELDTPLLK